MGLINLQTNLKSLRFGNDRVHGGNSGQPYVQTPIPEQLGDFGSLDTDFLLRGGSKSVVDSVKDVERLGKYFLDVRNPSGLLFVAKQNLLSRTAVRTQSSGILNEGVYTPLSTLAEAGGVAFGLHVNKQGLNPLEGLLSAGTSTPNQYADVVIKNNEWRVSSTSIPTIGPKFTSLNNVVINTVGITGETTIDNRDKLNRLVLLWNDNIFKNSEDTVNIHSYPGGPGSILGVGSTHIRFADQRTGLNNPLRLSNPDRFYGKSSNQRTDIPVNYRNALGLSISSSYNAANNVNLGDVKYSGIDLKGQGTSTTKYIGKDSNISINNIITGDDLKNYQSGLKNSETYRGEGSPGFPITVTADDIFINYKKFLGASTKFTGNTNPYVIALSNEQFTTFSPNNLTFEGVVTFDQSDIINIPTKSISTGDSTLTQKGPTTVTGDFRKTLNYNLPAAPNYTTKNIEQRVLLGNPGDRSGKNLLSYTNGFKAGKIYGYSGGNASESSYDKINALSLYSSTKPDDIKGNDLVKFRIGVINNDNPTLKTYIHFRAFLNQITDQYSSEWSDTKYIGRGEKFYTYSGFDRKVSLSWTVAAQSKAELIPMYKKLNFLASICAPDYSAAGYMRGNLVTLTVGGYFYEQPGIITGFSYEMNDDSATWEIGINDEAGSDNTVKELPHLIKVTGFNFIPIHTFVPRKQQMSYDPQGDILTDANQYGPERYIALANGFGKDENNYGPVYVNPVPVQPSPIPPVPPVPPPPPEFVPIKIETRNYDNGEKGKFKSDTTTSQNPLAGRGREFEAAAAAAVQ
jgi:hypothetical protein